MILKDEQSLLAQREAAVANVHAIEGGLQVLRAQKAQLTTKKARKKGTV